LLLLSPWLCETLNGQTASHGYVGGGVTVVIQPNEEPDFHYLNASTVGGVTFGLHLEGGAFLTRRLRVGTEFSLPSAVSGDREELGGGGARIESQVRNTERILTVLGAWHFGSGTFGVDPCAGISWVVTTSTINGRIVPFDPMYPAQTYEDHVSHTSIAATFGVDTPWRVAAHASLVPYFRLHRVSRLEFPNGALGRLPATIYRTGAALTMNF